MLRFTKYISRLPTKNIARVFCTPKDLEHLKVEDKEQEEKEEINRLAEVAEEHSQRSG